MFQNLEAPLGSRFGNRPNPSHSLNIPCQRLWRNHGHVDGGGKRGQNSGGLVTFHSAPFPLGRGCSLRTARSGQGRAGVARRSEPFTARTVLRSSTRGKGVALNGPLKWPSRSPPLTRMSKHTSKIPSWNRVLSA